MKLNGIDFGCAWNSSGARGFFGDPNEYRYMKYWRWAGLDWSGYTFVAKTTTTFHRPGNMPLGRNWRPRQFCPRCIVVKPLKGVVLNAVGLSGPGVEALLRTNKWQLRTEPFLLSYMPTASGQHDSLEADAATFGRLLAPELLHFRAPVALEVNLSCPNVEHGGNDSGQVVRVLQELVQAGVRCPLIPKFNALEPVSTAVSVSESRCCAAVAVGNTIPWRRAPDKIAWKRLFGDDASPLAALGGGGLSGKPLLPLTVDWVVRAKRWAQKPIIAGGGILSARDAQILRSAGADAVEVGVAGLLRPWELQSIRRSLQSCGNCSCE